MELLFCKHRTCFTSSNCCFLTGTKNILPERPKFWAWPHSVHIHFMEPIPTKGMSLSQKNELMEQVRQLISDYYVKHNRD